MMQFEHLTEVRILPRRKNVIEILNLRLAVTESTFQSGLTVHVNPRAFLEMFQGQLSME